MTGPSLKPSPRRLASRPTASTVPAPDPPRRRAGRLAPRNFLLSGRSPRESPGSEPQGPKPQGPKPSVSTGTFTELFRLRGVTHHPQQLPTAVTTERSAATTSIRPFTVEIPESDVEDLRARIAATRFPRKGAHRRTRRGTAWKHRPAAGRRAGDDGGAHALLGHPVRPAEGRGARLNALPQFSTEIDDLDIHFIHVKSRHENALPAILIHGWPGSVVEIMLSSAR